MALLKVVTRVIYESFVVKVAGLLKSDTFLLSGTYLIFTQNRGLFNRENELNAVDCWI